MIDSYDASTWENGRLVSVSTFGRSVQMLSDGSCGCQRKKEAGMSTLYPCQKHGEELAQRSSCPSGSRW